MKCYIIAGPNGAGKTKFAENFLPVEADCLNFINADLIARGIAPFNPESVALEAGKLFLKRMVERVRLRVAQGGHNVPVDVIKRRYHRGWKNFLDHYKDLVDTWVIFDNSGNSPVVVEEKP